MYPGISSDIKHFYQCSTTVGHINEYTERVRKGQVNCNLSSCLYCETTSDSFKHHEKRQRFFYTIAEQMIMKVAGLLPRWKCPGCGKIFTDYPDFAIPYKRYVLPVIMDYSSRYTENDQATYRRVIQSKAAGYPESESQLEYSTIHRWIGTLGSFTEILRKSQDLILQARPESSICRDLAGLSIPSKKYRSKERAGVLLSCSLTVKLLILDVTY